MTCISIHSRRDRVVIYNQIALIDAQSAEDCSQDIRGQTKQILAKLDEALRKAGTDKSQLLSARILLKNIRRDFAGMNEVWDAWLAPRELSSRATSQYEMADPDSLIEISVSAAVSD